MLLQILFLYVGLLVCGGNERTGGDEISNESLPDPGLTSMIQDGITRLMVEVNKLMLKTTEGKKNIVFSPINTYEIITILSTGSSDSVRDEICNVLNTPEYVDSTIHHLVVKKLLHMIHQYSTEVSTPNGCPPWKEGLQLKDWKPFFSALLNDSEFSGKDVVSELMDKWLPGVTEDPSVLRLKLTPVLKLMVASPVYFQENWKGIPKNVLLSDTFNVGDKTIDTRVIDHKRDLPYFDNPTMRYEAIAIPYENPHFAMYVVLPYENHTLTGLMENFNYTSYQELIGNLYSVKSSVHLRIPKLRFKWAANITEIVKGLGIHQIFDKIIANTVVSSLQLTVSFETRGAQLSLVDYFRPRISPRYTYENIKLQEILPDARLFGDNISVTETDIRFHLNRPFMFFIYNHETRVTLFSGLVFDPNVVNN